MSIPGFQEMMYPILGSLADGTNKRTRELVEELECYFDLTKEERAELLPSGTQRVAANRTNWAVSHLSKAGLVVRTGRGVVKISEKGEQALSQFAESKAFGMSYLRQFPEYRQFLAPGSGKDDASKDVGIDDEIGVSATVSPEELIEKQFQRLNRQLASDIIAITLSSSPAFFEQLVVQLLVAMGYGGSLTDAAKAVGKSGDDGIDGIIKEDKLGLDVVYVQAKRWQNVIGRPAIQGFAGSLEGHRARKGVFITTSSFTADARDYVGRIEKKIVLIDGAMLAQLMIEHGVGVTDVQTYRIKKIDSDYFDS